MPLITILGTVPGFPTVCVKNSTGLRELLNYLCDEMHYKKLAFVKGIDGNPDANERFDIFNAVMLEKGIITEPYAIHLEHPLLFQGYFIESDGEPAVEHFLPSILNGDIEVIMAANDGMAKGIISALHKRGIIVPADVAVTGFDNTRIKT